MVGPFDVPLRVRGMAVECPIARTGANQTMDIIN
jgi:hypothetical protein